MSKKTRPVTKHISSYDNLFIPTKRQKNSNTSNKSESKNKVSNINGNNRLAYRDESAASYGNYSIINDNKLPNSMKHDSIYIVPDREYQNATNLDDNLMRHNIPQPFVNNKKDENKHIISIIPNGFQEILPLKNTLDIAIKSCKKDAEIINNNIKDKKKDKYNQNGSNVTTFNVVGNETKSIYYTVVRVSKGLINNTLEDIYKKRELLELEFFSNDVFTGDTGEIITIPSDLDKSELFKKLQETYEKQYNNRKDFFKMTSTLTPSYNLPVLTREYIKTFRYPPIKGERLCINKNSCLFYTFKSFQSNKNEKYIGKEFLLPNDYYEYEKTKKLPEIVGPCIDCLLFDWTDKVHNRSQYNIVKDTAINTFTVRVEEHQYSPDICLNILFRNKQSTGIYGFVPAYAASQRAYITEKRKISVGLHVEEVTVTYLGEVNMDFRKPLV
jgi:hypothetical protein